MQKGGTLRNRTGIAKQMPVHAICVAVAVFLPNLPCPATAGSATGGAIAAEALQPGLYEITFRLELPNLGDAAPPTRHTRCLAPGAEPVAAFELMLDNNPLAKCPRSDLTTAANGELTFKIVCPGPNKPFAVARFTTTRDRFEGTFALNMGGKNMTITERQSGRRIGDCR